MEGAELRRRAVAYAVALLAVGAVLWPLRPGTRDSFPLSSYPMFAQSRGTPTLFAVVATTAAGEERSIPAALVASGEVLQTKVLIQRTVERGPAAMGELCQRTAAKLAPNADTELAHVDVVRRRYDPIGYFVSGPEPIERELLFRCPIRRAQARAAAQGKAER